MVKADFYDPTNGILQVSLTMLGMVCRKSGTGTSVTRQGGNTNPSTMLVDVTGYSKPVVAIRCDGYAAGQVSVSSSTANFASSAPIGTTFTYYVFDWSPALPANNGLIKVFDNGTPVFSSAFWPMKLIGLGPMSRASKPTIDAPGKILATACGGGGGHSDGTAAQCYDGGGPSFSPLESCGDIRAHVDGKVYGGQVQNGGAQAVGVDVSWDDVLASYGNYSSYQQYGGGAWEVDNNLMVIDVTNIPVGTTFF